MSFRPKKYSGSRVLIVSVILAGVIVSGFVKTPNHVGGGTAMMVLIIVLAVFFKATFEYFFNK
jgi:hypothetical protein